MTVRFTLLGALLLAMLCSSCEGLDTNYKFQLSRDCMNAITSSSNSYSAERGSLLDSYTGKAASNCKAQLNKQKIDQSYITSLKDEVTDAEKQVKTMDNQLYQETQKCGRDEKCKGAAMKKGELKFEDFENKCISDISMIKEDASSELKVYMENCMGS
uniref:Protein TsetseEP domain-containing protein n=1 Tax=Graphocephala atropunctata TaxID=36148 RepID=A0A1B6MG35_9HEMI